MPPSAVDTSTAGTTIITEFQKNGCRPLQSAPVHAVDQALPNDARSMACGSASSEPPRISSIDLMDVTTITYSGSRKKPANAISTAHSSQRCQVSERLGRAAEATGGVARVVAVLIA